MRAPETGTAAARVLDRVTLPPSSSSPASSKGYRLSLHPPSCIFCATASSIPLRTLRWQPFSTSVSHPPPPPASRPFCLLSSSTSKCITFPPPLPPRPSSYGSFYILPLAQPLHVGNKHSHGGDGSSAGVYSSCTPFMVSAIHSGAASAAAAAASTLPVVLPACVVVAPAPGFRSYAPPPCFPLGFSLFAKVFRSVTPGQRVTE